MKDRDPSLYLTHVLESIELARVYVEGVDIELVWTVVHRDLPELAQEVRGLLEQRRGDEGPG